MKKSIIFTLSFTIIGVANAQTHIIHDRTTSVTILPTSIQSNHVANQTVIKNNLVLGNNAMGLTTVNNANNNVAIGANTIGNPYDANYNVAVGHNANHWSVYSDKNVAIGYDAMKAHAPTSGLGDDNDDNVAVGYESLKNMFCAQSQNVGVGSQSLIGGAYRSVGIGFQAGFSGLSQADNVFIGYKAGYSETTSNKLYIENSNSTTPLIGGDFQNDVVGINMSVASLSANADGKLQVNGNVRVSGSINASTALFNSSIILTNAHYKLIYNGPGLHTIALPPAAGIVGREYLIVNHGQGSLQTIPYTFKTGFSSTDQYLLPGNVLHLVSDGTDWHKIN